MTGSHCQKEFYKDLCLAPFFSTYLDFLYAIEHSQVCNFADDSTISACGETLDDVAKCIENDMRMAMNWHKLNEIIANLEKFQLIFFGIKEDHELSIEINGDVIKMSDTVELWCQH